MLPKKRILMLPEVDEWACGRHLNLGIKCLEDRIGAITKKIWDLREQPDAIDEDLGTFQLSYNLREYRFFLVDEDEETHLIYSYKENPQCLIFIAVTHRAVSPPDIERAREILHQHRPQINDMEAALS